MGNEKSTTQEEDTQEIDKSLATLGPGVTKMIEKYDELIQKSHAQKKL